MFEEHNNKTQEPYQYETTNRRDGQGPPGGVPRGEDQNQVAMNFDSNWDRAIESFDDMELPEELLRGVRVHAGRDARGPRVRTPRAARVE